MKAHVSLACWPGLRHEAAAALLCDPIEEPLFGRLSAEHVQLVPQSLGCLDEALADALRAARASASDAVECVMQSAASIDAGYKAVADVRRVALNTDARASAYLAYAAAVNDTVVRAPEGTGCTSSN